MFCSSVAVFNSGSDFTRQLVFKELKSLYKLDVISSGAPVVVESLALVAMLTLVVSHRLLNHMRLLAPEKSARFTPLRWAESFYAIAPVMMARVLKAAGIDEDSLQLIIYFMGESPFCFYQPFHFIVVPGRSIPYFLGC